MQFSIIFKMKLANQFSIRYGMDDEKMQAYKDASAGRRASVFDPKALTKMKQSVSSSVKSAAESASTGVKNATDTGEFGF